ncbi:MAG: TonB-dependent receptor [Rhodospirillaceae bacterium]|nr:TonB-dependent receptor [Rhodospirillaceae bacterium]
MFPARSRIGFLRARLRTSFLTGAGIIAILSTQPHDAVAGGKSNFDIPAQSLSQALIQLATQADISIGLSGVNLSGKTSRTLVGYDNIDDALTRLLSGTGLTYEKVDAASYRIVDAGRAGPSPATQPAAPIPVLPIDEITVTAAKRPQSLQIASVSLAVVEQNPLSDYGLYSSNDAASLVAGLASTNQGAGLNKFFVRGLSDGAFSGNTQAAVSMYLDETNIMYRAPGPNLQLADIERIEVIRGPQGTLYGAGSIGGLMRVITRIPEFGRFSASGRFDASATDAGNPSGLAQAVANIPVVDDILAVRAVGYVRHDGGYIDNTRLNEFNTNTADTRGGRIAGRLRLSQDWTLKAGVVSQAVSADDSQYYDAAMPRLTRGNYIDEPHHNEFGTVYATLEGDLGWADFVSSTAWLRQDVKTTYDATLAFPQFTRPPLAAAKFDEKSRQRTMTHESRLASTPGQRISWVAGLFASNRTEDTTSLLTLLNRTINPTLLYRERTDKGQQLAIFGEGTLPLSQALSVTAGARLYRNRVDVVATGSDDPTSLVPDSVGSNDKYGITPKATISYQDSPRSLFYASVAQGFRLGGINLDARITSPQARRRGPTLTVRNFQSDKIWNFEVGSKSLLLDNTLAVNAAVFYSVWDDMQADLVRPNGLLYTANLGTAYNAGIEVDTTYALTDHLDLIANVSWSDPDLKQSNDAVSTLDVSRLPVMPKFATTLGAQYKAPLTADYDGFINGRFEYIGSSRLSNGAMAADLTRGYSSLSGRLGVERNTWKIALYVDNILNNRGNAYAFGNPFSFGRVSQVTPLRPRTVGVTLDWTY